MTRSRVVFVERQIRAFRMGFLAALAAILNEHDVELLAIDEDRREDQRYWDRLDDAPVELRSVPTVTRWIFGRELTWMSLGDVVRRTDLVVMPQQLKQLALYPLLVRQRLGGPRVALWGHGFTPSESTHPLARRAKRRLSLAPHWWFAYTDESARLVERFGYPRERITTVHNATDTTALRSHLEDVRDEDVAELRRELGVTGAPVAVFLGTFRPDKRLDVLWEAMTATRERVPDLALVLAGDGPEADRVADVAERLPWVHAAGSRSGRDAAVLLRMADVLVVPSWVGLVVVDGFAAGVPLVASASCPHPPEVGYIRDGVNGRLVDDGGDPRRYGDAVADVLLDDALGRRLVAGCRDSAERFSAERMAQQFATGVLAALRTRGGPHAG